MDYCIAIVSDYFGFVVTKDFIITSIIFAVVFVVFYAGALWVTRDTDD